MRKLDKRDFINLIIITLSFFVIFTIILLSGNGVYGSSMDFSSQHYMIPEYFRSLFYKTGDILPSYAFNLGMGQNIYYFSYYGLLSPIILLSYLFPFLKMITFINITSILLLLLSVLLFYKFISGYTENKNTRLVIGILFLLASPIIFHTHRHIMFVNYMVFVLMGLFGVERYIKESKKLLLIISVFLLIMTSYFYSIPGIITILSYGVFLWLKNNLKIKELFIKLFKMGLVLLIPVLMSGVLILPTFSAILNSRFEEKGIELLKMFIPDLSFNNIMYDHYSMGLTAILVLAISNVITKKGKDYKFLAYLFLVISFVPIIGYLLNGLMYLNGKVFIPFIPLALLLVTKFLNDLKKDEVSLKIVIPVFLIISLIGCINFNFDRILKMSYIFYIIDTVIILVTIFLITRNKREWFYYLFLIFPIGLALTVNSIDHLEKIEVVNNQYDKNMKADLKQLTNRDSNIYRTIDNSASFKNANNVRDMSQYKNTMYSSLVNKDYKRFNWYIFDKENPYRNDAIFSDNSNVLYNIFTGGKYYIGKNNEKILGYKKANSSNIMTSDDVFSIGYVNRNYMSEDKYKKLSYPYNIEALLNNTIIKDDVISDYKTNLKEVKVLKTSYNITNKKETKFKINTEEYRNKILIIRFNMNYAESCKVGDTYIKINGVSNLLTCKGWKYHNKNYTFEYVISDKDIKDLDIEMSKGHFEISDIKAYTLDYDYIKNINGNHDNLILDKTKTKGDVIYGSINVKEDGYLSLSIPYDKGYEVFIDGKKVSNQIVNGNFLGFKIDKGYHNVKIIYKAPLLNFGKVLSLLGVLILIVMLIFDKKRRSKL